MGSQVSTKSKLENWGDTTATMLCVYLWCIAYTTDILPNENVTHKKIIIFNIFLLGALKGGKEVVQSGLKKVFPCHVLGATISSTPEQEKYEGKKSSIFLSLLHN